MKKLKYHQKLTNITLFTALSLFKKPSEKFQNFWRVFRASTLVIQNLWATSDFILVQQTSKVEKLKA